MIDIYKLLALHSYLESNSMCLCGVRDKNLLESCIQGQYWFDTPERKIMWVAYSVCAGHIFIDGNKRTSFLVLQSLSELGIQLDWDRVADVILDLASSNIKSKEEFFNRILLCR